MDRSQRIGLASTKIHRTILWLERLEDRWTPSTLIPVTNSTTDQVIAYDTTTWAEQFRIDIGEHLSSTAPFGNGEMTVSDDGSLLFLATATGVRVLPLPASSTLPVGPDVAALISARAGAPTPVTNGQWTRSGLQPPEQPALPSGVASESVGSSAFYADNPVGVSGPTRTTAFSGDTLSSAGLVLLSDSLATS